MANLLKNSQPAVSVIIPIYKAEDTLLRCLDSLSAQTFNDYEVIMVDDGSPDRCGEMIDEYAKTHSCFFAFHQQNKGVSAARQYGIDHARGEYTIHADPDDWVESNMLKDLYEKAKSEDADMVICDYYEDCIDVSKYCKQQPSSLDHLSVLHDLFTFIHGSTCNKLIRRDCYKRYNVKFPLDLSLWEDQYVIAALLKNDIKVAYLPIAFYHYIRNVDRSSLSLRYTDKSYDEDVRAMQLFEKLLHDTSIVYMVNNIKGYSIVAHAFFGGKDLYSSREFRKRFLEYKRFTYSIDASTVDKVLIYLSCLGLYQPMIRVVYLYMQIKRWLLK